MTTSIIDEDVLLTMLHAPVTKEHIQQLQTGAAYTLLDMYDRKVTREEYIIGMQMALDAYNSLGKLWVLAVIENKVAAGAPLEPLLAASYKAVEELGAEQATALIAYVKRLKECPETGDTIN